MQPQLIVIQTAEGIEELREYLKDKEYVADSTQPTNVGAHGKGLPTGADSYANRTHHNILSGRTYI